MIERFNEFLDFLISTTNSSGIKWIEQKKDQEFVVLDLSNSNHLALRLRVCEGIFFINLDIYENGIRVFCTDYHEDLKPLKDKLWDLLWTIRKDKQKKRVVGVFVQSLGNDLLYNILASLMINARKREETNRLYQRLDNLILQLGECLNITEK
jgi:hypothetical protein